MMTIFAQGHTAVTGIHLGRLAISSLHYSALAPKTWAELFWAADHKWEGPLGLLETLWALLRIRRKISFTFLLFMTTSLVALFTPTVLDRAYSRDLDGPTTFGHLEQMLVLGPRTMDGNITSRQLTLGASGWITGRQADDLYSEHLYHNHNGTFISGWIPLHPRDTVVVSGLEVKPLGSICRVIDVKLSSDMKTWCSQNGLGSRYEDLRLRMGDQVLIAMKWCTGFNSTVEKNWMHQREGHTTTVAARVSVRSTDMYINCTSDVRFGNATISRPWNAADNSSLPYRSFEPIDLFGGVSSPLDQPPFLPPLYAAFVGLSQRLTPSNDTEISTDRSASLVQMLGYSYWRLNQTSGQGIIDPDPPSRKVLLEQLTRGVMHMATAIHLGGAFNYQNHYVSKDHLLPQSAIAYERIQPWVSIAWALLATWLTLLVLGTARMYRRTFGSALDSYTAARLMADSPHLVAGYCAGAPNDNPKLRTRFERVGDQNPNEEIGHVASGGGGLLDGKRRYGAKSALYPAY
jgi:hypothetical protein